MSGVASLKVILPSPQTNRLVYQEGNISSIKYMAVMSMNMNH
jgi:hypothetical protein